MEDTRDDSAISAGDTLIKMQDQTKAQQEAADAGKSQADTTKRSLLISETILETTEAADIQIGEINCSNTAMQPVAWGSDVSIHWKNTGKTRADHVLTLFAFTLKGWPPPQPLPGKPSESSVGAGQPINTETGKVNEFIDNITFARVNHGELEMHLVAWVTWVDVFKKHHRVDFDARYTPKSSCGFMTNTITTQ